MAVGIPDSTQLALLRGRKQYSRLYLAIRKPATIYTARVNGAPSSNDMVGQVSYNTGSGTLANVKTGMAMYVGTTAGARNLGIVRIRKTPTSDTFYIGEESEVDWQDQAYLTVVDDPCGIWPRHIKVISNVPYMDFDIAYSDQNTNFEPEPLLGSDVILWLTGASVSVVWPTVAGSYVVDGSAISSYLWTAPGASGTSGLTTPTPTFTYNAAGQYRVYCTITAANGKTFTSSRTIYVFSSVSMPEKNFRLVANPHYSGGGWEYDVELLDGADVSEVAERTKVILFAQDYYNGVEQSIGPIPAKANIICEGWIKGDEGIEWDPASGGQVRFSVANAAEWFKRIPAYAVGLELRTAGANAWTNMAGLTVRRMLWHLLHWRTTASEVIDVNLTNDARMMQSLNIQASNLWNQITINSTPTIRAVPLVDRYGAFYCYVDQQVVPTSDRSSFPNIMTLTKKDWSTMSIRRRTVSEGARVELSGVSITAGTEPKAYFSLAPGHVPKRYGEIIPADHLLLSNQAQANELAGLILAHANRELEFDFTLQQNNRMVDIAPSSFLLLDIVAGDTLRGIAFSGKVVIREIEYVWNEARNYFSTRIAAEQETNPDISQNGDIPGGDTPIVIPPIPPIPPIPIPPSVPSPIPVPTGASVKTVIVHVSNKGIFYTKNFDASVPNWFGSNEGLNATRINNIFNFEVTSSGAMVLLTNDGGTDGDEVWWSEGLGEAWELIFDASMVHELPYSFPRDPKISAVGVNRSAPDEIAMIAGKVYTIGGLYKTEPYIGPHTALAYTGLEKEIAGADPKGHITFLSNSKYVWAFAISSGPLNNAVINLARPGNAYTNQATFGNSGQHTVSSPRVLSLAAVMYTSPIRRTIDGGTTWDTMTSPPTAYSDAAEAYQSAGIDPTGDYILVGDSAGILLKRSSDGGATWGNSPVISGTTHAVWNLGTELDWVIGFAGQVRFSEDFFTTYVDRTGDLWTVLGASSTPIVSIRNL